MVGPLRGERTQRGAEEVVAGRRGLAARAREKQGKAKGKARMLLALKDVEEVLESDCDSVLAITDDEYEEDVDMDEALEAESAAEAYDVSRVDSSTLGSWITASWAAKVEACPKAHSIKEVFDMVKPAREEEAVNLACMAMLEAEEGVRDDPAVFTLTVLWLAVLFELTSASVGRDFWARKKFIKAYTQSGKTFYTILDGVFKSLHGFDVVLFGTSDGSTYDHIQSAMNDVASEFQRLTSELSERNPFRLETPLHFWRLNEPRPQAMELECVLNVRVAQIFNVRSFLRNFGDRLQRTHVSLDEAHTIFGGAQVHQAFRELIFEVPSATYVSATCELNQIMHGDASAVTVSLRPRPGYYMELEEPDAERRVFKLHLKAVENVPFDALNDLDGLEQLMGAFSSRSGAVSLAPRWVSHLATPSPRNFLHVVINPLLASNEGRRGRSANAGHVAIARWLTEQHAGGTKALRSCVFGFAMYQSSTVLPREYYRPRLFMDRRIYRVLQKSASRRGAFEEGLGRIFTTNKREANYKNEVSEKAWEQIRAALGELSVEEEGEKTVSLKLGFRPTPKVVNSLILLIYAAVSRLGFKGPAMEFDDERKWAAAFDKRPLQIFFVGSYLLRHSVNVESKCRNVQVTHLTAISKGGGHEGLAEKHQQVGRVNHGLWASCFGRCAFPRQARGDLAAMPPTLYMSPPLLEQLQLKFRADEEMAREIREAIARGEEVDPEETAERYGKRTRAASTTHMGRGKIIREHTDAALHRGGKKARLGPLSDDHIQWRKTFDWKEGEIEVEDAEVKRAFEDWVAEETRRRDVLDETIQLYAKHTRVFLETTQWPLGRLAETEMTDEVTATFVESKASLRRINKSHLGTSLRRFQKYLRERGVGLASNEN